MFRKAATFLIKSLLKAFDVSRIAQDFAGPKMEISSFKKASTIPNDKGFSGPTITKSILFSFKKETRSEICVS